MFLAVSNINWRALLGLILTVGLVLSWPISVQALDWGSKTELDESEFGGSLPLIKKVAVSPKGVVHVLWQIYGNYNFPFVYTKGQLVADSVGNVSIDLEPVRRMADNSRYATHDIVVDNYENPHIVYRTFGGDIIYMYNPAQGDGGWISENLGNYPGFAYDIEVDGAGVPYITFSNYEADFESWGWLTFRLAKGVWVKPFVISPDINPRIVRGNDLEVTGFGPDAKVYVTYEIFPDESSRIIPYMSIGNPGTVEEPGSFRTINLIERVNKYLNVNNKGAINIITEDPITGQLYMTFNSPGGDGLRAGFGQVMMMSKDGGSSWSQPLYMRPSRDKWTQGPSMEASHNVLHMADNVSYNVFGHGVVKTIRQYTSFDAITWKQTAWENPGEEPGVTKRNPSLGVGGPGVFIAWSHKNIDGVEYNEAYLDRFVGPVQ